MVAMTISKHIRMDGKLWQRLERAASERETSANRLLSELATQWLDNREWPPTEAQIQTARASLFAAQAIARDIIAAGREHEIEEIRQFILTIAPGRPPTSRDRPIQERKLTTRTATLDRPVQFERVLRNCPPQTVRPRERHQT